MEGFSSGIGQQESIENHKKWEINLGEVIAAPECIGVFHREGEARVLCKCHCFSYFLSPDY